MAGQWHFISRQFRRQIFRFHEGLAEILEDEFLFACGTAHPLAGVDAVSLEALAGERLLLLEEGHCLRGHALDACKIGDARARATANSF